MHSCVLHILSFRAQNSFNEDAQVIVPQECRDIS